MLLRNLGDAKELFCSVKGSFLGAGITAFSRITPSHLLDSYRILCLRKTRDLPLIRRRSTVMCLEEELGQPLHGEVINSFQLLNQEMIRNAVAKLPPPRYLLLYQNYPELERLARQEKWHLLANPFRIRNRVGTRAAFKKMVHELRLPPVKGKIYPLRVLHEMEYLDWVRDLGSPLAIQLPDISQGGGRGTFFTSSSEAYGRLRERLRGDVWRGTPLTSVSVNEYIHGVPVSMALCNTRHGLLMSPLQRQLIDLPYCDGMEENGVFCGHVWNDTPWPNTIKEEARRQVKLIGGYLNRMGYRGIFGVDFVIDEHGDRLVPIELNPRYTGAFPVLSLLHMEHRQIPMEMFHMLEFMGVDYRIHLEEINEGYGSSVRGSHLLVFLPRPSGSAQWHNMRAGVYQYDDRDRKISYVRDSIQLRDADHKGRFVVVDGPPAWLRPGECDGDSSSADPLARLCRLLFTEPVMDSTVLSSAALGIVSCILGNDQGWSP